MKILSDEERIKLYPEGIFEVYAGNNELINLIVGTEKTAVIDCGRAFCGEEMVENVKKALGGRKLDYVFATHSHYDHIGALPYFKKMWPDLVCYGSEYAQYVLTRPGAIKTIKKMGDNACIQFSDGNLNRVITEGLSIDVALKEGDKVSLGANEMIAIETKGHTDCCLSFALEPECALFTSESTGVFEGNGNIDTSILKSYDDTMISLKKCREYDPEFLIAPHFGIVSKEDARESFDIFEKNAVEEREFIMTRASQGKSAEEIFEELKDAFWTDYRAKYQLFDAFKLNAQNTIKIYMDEVKND